MLTIMSHKTLDQLKRDERHKGITLGYQLAQSERTGKGFIYGGIQFERQPGILKEVEQIMEQKGF